MPTSGRHSHRGAEARPGWEPGNGRLRGPPRPLSCALTWAFQRHYSPASGPQGMLMTAGEVIAIGVTSLVHEPAGGHEAPGRPPWLVPCGCARRRAWTRPGIRAVASESDTCGRSA
jgi:hypothetical protein